MGLIRDRSRRSAPIKMLIFGLFLIGLQAYLAAGSGAAQFVVGFSLKKLLIQVPAGIVAVFIASKIFEFDFGTIGTIAKNIAGITVLAEGVACWIPIPFFSIMADLTVMLVGFFVLFELSKWQTYLIVLLNFAVLFGAHYLLANYNNQTRSYGPRPRRSLAGSQSREAGPARCRAPLVLEAVAEIEGISRVQAEAEVPRPGLAGRPVRSLTRGAAGRHPGTVARSRRSGRSTAVAVGAHAPRHRSIGLRIFEQPAGLRDDRLGILADQPGDSGLDRLGPLAFVPHDEDRSSQRRRFLLHSARVGQDDRRPLHRRDERPVSQRATEMHARKCFHQLFHDRTDRRIGMDRPEKLDVGKAVVQLLDRPADPPERLAERIAAVGRHQHQPFSRIELDPDRDVAPGCRHECVDHRVARDEDPSRIDPFSHQVVAGRSRGSEMDRAQMRRDDAVGLFGKRSEEPASAQARLDMAEGDVTALTGQGRGNHGRGVPLRQHHVGALFAEDFDNGPHEMRGQSIERQFEPHDIQVDIRLDPEKRQAARRPARDAVR